MKKQPTKRQLQIVENFIKNETKRLMKEGKTKYVLWTPQSNIKEVGDAAVSEFVKYGFQAVFPEEWLQDKDRDWADTIWFKLPSKLSAAQLKFLLGTKPDEAGMHDGYFSLWWD